ncbi:PAC2 family protein [Candidatus Bathyarchaeota archaeon]|nr:PAC2 family protein [Candidatus Bathyarchaeota archaeon]
MDIKFFKKPSFKEPSMIAAWPGMGLLAVISADYLRRKLDAKLFAELYSPKNSVFLKNGIIEPAKFKHLFYYWNNLIICIGEAQPPTPLEVRMLAEDVLNIAEEFEVKRIYTLAASPAFQQEELKVFGIVNKEELLKEVSRYVSIAKGEGDITGLNGVLLGIAKERNLDGICLLGQIRYMDMPQFRSARLVLEVLTKMLNIEVDLSELNKEAEKLEESIKEGLKRLEGVKKEEKEKLEYIG